MDAAWDEMDAGWALGAQLGRGGWMRQKVGGKAGMSRKWAGSGRESHCQNSGQKVGGKAGMSGASRPVGWKAGRWVGRRQARTCVCRPAGWQV
eukprot:101740-Chlamydomonas_euryale.AAC.1